RAEAVDVAAADGRAALPLAVARLAARDVGGRRVDADGHARSRDRWGRRVRRVREWAADGACRGDGRSGGRALHGGRVEHAQALGDVRDAIRILTALVLQAPVGPARALRDERD